jgi:ABC-type glutathione transport system ATPase component
MSPLLKIENLAKRYKAPRHHRAKEINAFSEVTFSIDQGTTLALVGESGSGKSTLALCLACLERPSSGTIWFDGQDITALGEKKLRQIRPQIQLVFQDPAGSLNPRWTIREILTEPLILQCRVPARETQDRAVALLEKVHLAPDLAGRRAGELSGGQKQRIAIARALSLEPKLLILDEVLSALDCSVQAQIANLLLELQASLSLTYVFITHDVAMAAHLADEIAVLHRGKIVEQGPPAKILQHPQHAATQNLLAATPRFSAPTAPPAQL